MTSETYPSGDLIATGYDAANRPTVVTNGSTNYISVGSYAPSGAAAAYTFGNGIGRTLSLNNRLQPVEMADALSGSPASPLLDLTYFYGGVTSGTTTKNNGNPTQIGIATRQTPSSSVVGFTQTFSYDALNRIAGVSDTGGWSQTLGYDRYGNMSGTQSGLTGVPALPSSGSYGATTNRLTSSGVGYDAGGNQTTLGSATLSYDGENRQSIDYDSLAVTTVDYAYDGLGQRVSKTVVGGSGSTTYVHDALGNLAAEYTTSTEAPPCTTCYLSWDHLGSTRMVTDQSGNVVANGRHDFLPFGYEIPAGVAGRTTGVWGGPDYLSAKFTGQERDTESGFDNFPARYMASVQGRFMSVDPGNAGADLGNPQSWNGYGYALNNPIALIDPSGLCTVVNGVFQEDGGQPCPANPSTSMTVTEDGGSWLTSTSLPPGSCLSVILDGVPQNNGCDSSAPVFAVTVTTPGQPAASQTPGSAAGRNPFVCGSEAASKVSPAALLHRIPGLRGGVGGFVVDAAAGNVFSGVTDLVHSIATGEGGDHSVLYNMGQGVVAGPSQGLSPVFTKVFGKAIEGPFTAAPMDLAMVAIFGEYATGIGEVKLAYDAVTYVGAVGGCLAGIFH